MSERTDQRRKALREKLLDAAEAMVIAEGSQALRVRTLASEAGCAVGAVYNVFDDLNGIIMGVNARTFHRLGEEVVASISQSDIQQPQDALIKMGHAYLHFASNNLHTWRALFDLEMSVEQDVPSWYLEELGKLFAIIAKPLSELRPDLSSEQRAMLTRALFSSVHGIVSLSLEKRISGVPLHEAEDMISMVLEGFVSKP